MPKRTVGMAPGEEPITVGDVVSPEITREEFYRIIDRYRKVAKDNRWLTLQNILEAKESQNSS